MVNEDKDEIDLEGYKLIYIPFANQQSSYPKLIRHFGERFVNILLEYLEMFDTKVAFYQPYPKHLQENKTNSWGEFYELVKEAAKPFLATRLIHLKPVGFTLDEETGLVSLTCEYYSKGLDKYIPNEVKVIANIEEGMADAIIAGTKSESSLWDLAPICFVVPCFGRYE